MSEIVYKPDYEEFLIRTERDLKKESEEILAAIEKIKKEIAVSKACFNMATDEALIDSCIYELTALNKRYQYFLKMAKEMGIVSAGERKTG